MIARRRVMAVFCGRGSKKLAAGGVSVYCAYALRWPPEKQALRNRRRAESTGWRRLSVFG